MASRRLHDRIRALCAKAAATPESPELNEILRELQNALHEHIAHLRKLAAAKIFTPERRSKPKD